MFKKLCEVKDMKKEINKKRIIAISLLFTFLVGTGITGFFTTLVEEGGDIEKAVETYGKWNLVSATNVSVGNGLTGIKNVGTYTHQSSPYTLYDDALIESNFYEAFDETPACAEELNRTTPHSTLFDFVVIIQWDYDHAYNTSSTAWEKDLVKVYINISSTDTEINAVSTEVMLEGDFYDIDGTNDALMNVYVVGTGGFDLGQNVKYTIDNIKLYYWG
jgi:hypothetical protein